MEDITTDIEKGARDNGYSVAKLLLPSGKGIVLTLHKPSLTEDVFAADKTLVGLFPSALLVMQSADGVHVGMGNPRLLSGVTPDPKVQEAALTLDADLRHLINTAAGGPPPKITNVKLFSTKECPYCKMEKDYLDSKKVQYELVMVDTDRKAAEEMVRATGQMGVPVTQFDYDSADSEYVIGFNKERIDEILTH